MTRRSEWEREAWRRWPRACWVSGSGPWALVALCGGPRRTSISLWQTEEDAVRRKASLVCGSGCSGSSSIEHKVIDLRLPAPVPKPVDRRSWWW
jgi:hypothetical protein